jgi:hypothetical protein
MNAPQDNGRLNQGGPGDQSGPRPSPQDGSQQGSQSGRPQSQEPLERPWRPGEPAPGASADEPPEKERGISDTERRGGTPDPRATTDGLQGEGGVPPAIERERSQ